MKINPALLGHFICMQVPAQTTKTSKKIGSQETVESTAEIITTTQNDQDPVSRQKKKERARRHA